MSNSIKSICWHIGGGDKEAKIADMLGKMMKKEYDIEMKFFCINNTVYNNLTNKGYQCINETEFDSKVLHKSDIDEIYQWFKKQNILDFREVYYTTYIQRYEKLKKEQKLLKQKVIKRLYLLREKFNTGFNADVFMSFAGDDYKHNLIYFYSQLCNAPMLRFRESVFPERMGITNNKFGVWQIPEFNKITGSEEEVNYVHSFYEKYLQEKKVFWGDPKERDFKINISNKNLLRKALNPQKRRNLSLRIKRYLNKLRVENVYEKTSELDDINYFYFPLHYPYDSQLILRGRPFIHQVNFMEIISEFLPENYHLVVKEHPHARGAISLNQLKRLKKNSRIKLLHPWENSHNLIKSAKAVLVINSTVALEALYHGKPVISFGQNYFTGHKIVEEFSEFYDLYKLYRWNPKYTSDYLKDRLMQFLIQGYRHSYPIASKKVVKAKMNSDDEVRILSRSIVHYLDSIMNNTKSSLNNDL